MVIVTDGNGQLCNRLFHFSYFIANAIEYNYSLVYPCFDQYSVFFDSTNKNYFFNLPLSLKISPFRLLDRVILKFSNKYKLPISSIHYLDIRSNTSDEVYDLKNDYYQELAHKKVVLTKGWMFRDEENLKKHRLTLKQIFTPAKPYAEAVQNLVNKLHKDYDCIVGVHIRRGDYISWNEGRYFYTDDVYLRKMQELEQHIRDTGRSCCFFIASNENIDSASFPNLNVCIGERHFMVDLYTLAACNYIIGPPSTFSYWAAFYGSVPLLVLEQSETPATPENFFKY